MAVDGSFGPQAAVYAVSRLAETPPTQGRCGNIGTSHYQPVGVFAVFAAESLRAAWHDGSPRSEGEAIRTKFERIRIFASLARPRSSSTIWPHSLERLYSV